MHYIGASQATTSMAMIVHASEEISKDGTIWLARSRINQLSLLFPCKSAHRNTVETNRQLDALNRLAGCGG
jgi:hypothetical protein